MLGSHLKFVIPILAMWVPAGCGHQGWPEAPLVDQATYDSQHASWRQGQRDTAVEALEILSVWGLPEGDTPFGADRSLAITLPASSAPPRVGVFRRNGADIVVIPEPGVGLQLVDGPRIERPRHVDGVLALGSLRFIVDAVGEGPSDRRFLTIWDEDHPVARQVSEIDIFPVERRWRVAARFEAFDTPRIIRVPDVRGGTMDLIAPGQLVFRLADQEWRLTSMASEGDERFWVMFKDATNGDDTYGGYRNVYAPVVGDGDWTVLDFNMAGNPPCAYSPFTLCPLPPRENRLDIPVEAGEKRFASAK